MYIIAVIFFNILLYCLKGYSETLKDAATSTEGITRRSVY